jgi:hypothetical protein
MAGTWTPETIGTRAKRVAASTRQHGTFAKKQRLVTRTTIDTLRQQIHEECTRPLYGPIGDMLADVSQTTRLAQQAESLARLIEWIETREAD